MKSVRMVRRNLPIVIACLASGGLGCHGKAEPTPNVDPVVWNQWVMLDQPEASLRIGDAFALSGAPDTTCYTRTDSRPSPSTDHYFVNWNKATKGSLDLNVAKAVGLGVSAGQAESGKIEFDSLFIVRGANVRPVVDCGDANSVDGLPKRPGISALLGAKAFRYELTDANQKSLSAQAAKELAAKLGGQLSISDTSRRSVTINFASPRFIAAQFVGYEPEGRADTVTTATANMDMPVQVAWGYSAVAHRPSAGGPASLVIQRVGSGPTQSFTVDSLRHGSAFAFGRKATDGVAGAYMVGTYFDSPDNSQFKLTVVRRGLKELDWTVQSMRDSLLAWTSHR